MNPWGQPDGQPLLFLHANSYSAKMYRYFLEPLGKQYHILNPDLPGHGASSWNGRINDWEDLADYYIAQLDRSPPVQPMIGMGHSIGGIIVMLMAIKRPMWFEKVILLDPVMLSRRILNAMRLLRLFSLTHIIPLARAASRRRNQFPTRDEALQHYAKKAVFSRLRPQFLEAYVETCLREDNEGAFQLCCSPQLESSIYQSIPLNVWRLPSMLPPKALFMVGQYSDTITGRGLHRLQQSGGNHIVKSISAGHLFPFEKPEEAMDMVKEYLSI